MAALRQNRNGLVVRCSWFIESALDRREYLAFDVSTNAGATWIEMVSLKGNVDPENIWQNVSINLSNINSLQIRFRAKMSLSDEDADVDMVKVIAK